MDKFINKRKKLSKIYDKAFKNSKKFKPVLNDNKDLSSRHIYILKINSSIYNLSVFNSNNAFTAIISKRLFLFSSCNLIL